MDTLTSAEIKKRFEGRYWVSPYKRIIAMRDKNKIELIEDHARGMCYGGAAWEVHHYPRTSPLVYYSKRDGARNIFRLKSGEVDLDLIPGLAAAGVEKVSIEDDAVKIQYSGLGGAGVAIAMARGQAEGVKHIEVHEWGGGGKSAKAAVVLPVYEKLVFGIDDTDTPTSGATWALANEIGFNLDKEEDVHYIGHTINQLYPQNPHKTQNCVSIAISFAVRPGSKKELIALVKGLLERYTESPETGMAVFNGFEPPEPIRQFGRRAKMKMVELEEAAAAAKEGGVDLIRITGDRGLIGAAAAIAFYDEPDMAVRLDV